MTKTTIEISKELRAELLCLRAKLESENPGPPLYYEGTIRWLIAFYEKEKK